MNPFITDARFALQRAGYFVQEQLMPSGMKVCGVRSGNDRPYFLVFGTTPEEAYLRACAAAQVNVNSYLRMS